MVLTLTLERRYLVYVLAFYCIVSTLYCWLPSLHSIAKGSLAWQSSIASTNQSNFVQNASSDFPHKIWQTAKVNMFALNSGTQASIQTWTDKNRNHRYELITAERGESYVTEKFAHRPDLVGDFLALQDPMLRADLVQYLFLLTDGGVYTDLDTKCLKPIDTWIPDVFKAKANLVLGIEGDSLSGLLIPGFSHPVQFATWTMAVKPGHFLIELIIDRVLNQLHNLAIKQNTTIDNIKATYMDVMDTTGPGVFAESIYQGLSQISHSNMTSANLTGMTEPRLIGDVLILPITSFGSGLPHSNAGDTSDPSALVQHTFAGTWKADHPLELAEEQDSKYEQTSSDGTDIVGKHDQDIRGIDTIKEKRKFRSERRREKPRYGTE